MLESAHRLGKRFHWVGSDGWGKQSHLVDELQEVAEGAITLELTSQVTDKQQLVADGAITLELTSQVTDKLQEVAEGSMSLSSLPVRLQMNRSWWQRAPSLEIIVSLMMHTKYVRAN